MKKLLGLFIVAIILTIGVIGYVFISDQKLEAIPRGPVIKSYKGTIQKSFDTYTLKEENTSIPIYSSNVMLNQYLGGTVEITGYYIESKFYVESVKEIK